VSEWELRESRERGEEREVEAEKMGTAGELGVGGGSYRCSYPRLPSWPWGACNVPPPRGLRTGKLGKMHAAMIYIGRMRV